MALSEDYRVNRLTEALDLFEEISTSEFFSETGPPPSPLRCSLFLHLTLICSDFFMFFNKDDMFREKVKNKRFVEHFKDYKGDSLLFQLKLCSLCIYEFPN